MCNARWDGNDLEMGEQRTARKEHECGACGETIRKGHRYHIYKALYDGSWWSIKHCERCNAMVDALCGVPWTDGVVMTLDCGETWESASGEPPPPHIAALAFWLPGEPLPAHPGEGSGSDAG